MKNWFSSHFFFFFFFGGGDVFFAAEQYNQLTIHDTLLIQPSPGWVSLLQDAAESDARGRWMKKKGNDDSWASLGFFHFFSVLGSLKMLMLFHEF